MSEVPKPPEPALERQSGASLLASISREMVKAMKTYYGRGPTKAKSYLMDDLLFIVMREGITQAEETMLSAGKGDEVQSFRRQFEKIMAERLVGTIEQLTDREVLAYQSQIPVEPPMVVQVFVFDKPLERPVVEETARAVLIPDVGVVTDEDVKIESE